MDESFAFTLIEKFESTNLTKLSFSKGEFSLSLEKGTCSCSHPQPHLSESASLPNFSQDSTKVKTQDVKKGESFIQSPLVGTFYRAASPDSHPFVEVGYCVKKGQPLCILEAMKMMSKLEAEFDCEILEIFGTNGTLVEYDEPLFRVKKND